MTNKEKVKSAIKDLIQQLYEAKGFNNLNCNPLERNIFEAEMKELWENVETYIILYADDREEYEEEIESLKDQLGDVKEEYDALMVKYEDLEEDYKDLEKTLDKVKEAIWS